MSAPFIIPFDNNPSSVINLTSAGYTIPAGKYARIDYRLYSGVLNIDGNMVATATSTDEGLQYASGTTSVGSTSEITLITATNSNQGYFKFSWVANNSTNGSTVTFRHKRGGIVIGQTALIHDGTNARTATWWGFIVLGDILTVQQTSVVANARSVTLYGDATVGSSNQSQGTFWLGEGSVITFSSSLPVSVSGIIQLYNKIS